jgi:hypothetical protein
MKRDSTVFGVRVYECHEICEMLRFIQLAADVNPLDAEGVKKCERLAVRKTRQHRQHDS